MLAQACARCPALVLSRWEGCFLWTGDRYRAGESGKGLLKRLSGACQAVVGPGQHVSGVAEKGTGRSGWCERRRRSFGEAWECGVRGKRSKACRGRLLGPVEQGNKREMRSGGRIFGKEKIGAPGRTGR